MSLIQFSDSGDPVVLNTNSVAYIEKVKDEHGEGCNIFFIGVDNPRRFGIPFDDLLAMLDFDSNE